MALDSPPLVVNYRPDPNSSGATGSDSGIAYSGQPNQEPRDPPQNADTERATVRGSYVNGPTLFDTANSGDMKATFQTALEGLQLLGTEYAVKTQLNNHINTHLIARDIAEALAPYGANPERLTIDDNTESAYIRAGLFGTGQPSDPGKHDFFGTALMPIMGIGYWILGQGADRHVDIGSLNWSAVPRDFKPLNDMLNDLNVGPGSYHIDSSFSANLFDNAINLFAAGLLGRFSGGLIGDLTITPDGRYSFSGDFTMDPDRFDADLSNRTWFQENLTNLLRWIGGTFGHQDYYIIINGTQHVEFSGSKTFNN
ncbi:lipid II-degrading bacteriocin [Pseudomonas oryzihabitans]|uniref:lipid II-degrading bacteriocin n=1 Tax=Pseudomonas oryzihabitans TaxID=47885 RepID=UPI002894F7A5|nr:lipid II-degrading bacteriocin [Pseudomonas oryzihabitans]MDT3721263.1 lipid II-degrading bacteriocin [Pseudomonas oryzihabitans]